MRIRYTAVAISMLSICLAAVAAPTQAQAPPAPSGRLLLLHSLAAMKHLHRVHGEGALSGGQVRGTGLRISADCEGQVPLLTSRTPRTYDSKYSSWARGTLVLKSRTTTVDDYFIFIQSKSGKHSWIRSGAARSRWQATTARMPEPVNAFYGLQMCMPLFVNSYRFPVDTTWQNLGQTTFHGRPAWHLDYPQLVGGGKQVTTVYIDTQRLYWLRFSTKQVPSHGRPIVEAFDYSRFDLPVTIRPPKA